MELFGTPFVETVFIHICIDTTADQFWSAYEITNHTGIKVKQ